MGLDEVFVAIGRVAGLGHSESRLQLGASAGAFDRIWSDDRQMGREARTLLHRAWGGGTLATDFRLHKLGADSKAGQHECWKDSCDAPFLHTLHTPVVETETLSGEGSPHQA